MIKMRSLNPSKQFTIAFDDRTDYLYACVTADSYSYQIVSGYCEEISTECKKNSHAKVLIEENIAESVSMVEMYKITTQVPQKFLAGIQIAFVDDFPEQSNLNKFGEIVAVHAGVHGRVFTNVTEAEEWLRQT